MSRTRVCLGCGAERVSANGDCAQCELIAAKIIERSHWPLEASMTPAALVEVEHAIRHHILATGENTELSNLANTIRAHLQHVVANARKAAPPTDEDLLR